MDVQSGLVLYWWLRLITFGFGRIRVNVLLLIIHNGSSHCVGQKLRLEGQKKTILQSSNMNITRYYLGSYGQYWCKGGGHQHCYSIRIITMVFYNLIGLEEDH